ncbi:hypothetical protein A3B63_01135 [Candidatus Saccharibacteria bacterium RIFCSPLOWO2_01_FULL_49_22]|nr:MAG: hypothetical protein A3B63_01135 [Candidatus Saccharibacteria bacterium RIFCSPLOWO2_01_FULL_49_22]
MIRDKLSQFRKVPYGVFLVLFVISLVLSIYALRQNNQQMLQLRAAVYEADKGGGNVEKALADLRSYVHGHMNTSLSSGGNSIKPPIQLKYTYERLVTAQQAEVNAANSQLYTEAQNYCQAQNPSSFSGGPRVPCIEEYIATYGIQAGEINIPASLYKFDFVSPTWSPELAGWSLMVTAVLFLVFAASFVADRAVSLRLKKRQL